jgi:hypothetical protein
LTALFAVVRFRSKICRACASSAGVADSKTCQTDRRRAGGLASVLLVARMGLSVVDRFVVTVVEAVFA